MFNFLSIRLSFLDSGQDEGGGSNGPSNGGNGSNLPHSNSAASLHHLTAGNVPIPGSGHHSGSSIDASSADLQHKVSMKVVIFCNIFFPSLLLILSLLFFILLPLNPF